MDILIFGSSRVRVVEREGTNPSTDRQRIGIGLRISRIVIDRQIAPQDPVEIGNLRTPKGMTASVTPCAGTAAL